MAPCWLGRVLVLGLIWLMSLWWPTAALAVFDPVRDQTAVNSDPDTAKYWLGSSFTESLSFNVYPRGEESPVSGPRLDVTYSAAPEPGSTLGLAIGALALAGLARRSAS